MSTPEVEAKLRAQLDGVVDRYGKIGLLIDDASDAGSRAARTIYGSETLPRWWLLGRSVPCARTILAWFAEQVGLRTGLHGIVVLDRYLPISCKESQRVVPWDVPPDSQSDEVRRQCMDLRVVADELLEIGKTEDGVFVELETSYPHRLPSETASKSLVWKTRNPDLLYRLRRDIENTGPTGLLAYGPDKEAAGPFADPSGATEADWTASVYQRSLNDLAKALKNQSPLQPVVLLTGAGASRGASRLGRGVPSTETLLEEACRHVQSLGSASSDPENEPPPASHEQLCVCVVTDRQEGNRDSGRKKWEEESGKTPVEWMVDRVKEEPSSIRSLDWQLEELFSKERNQSKLILEEFRDGFRAALHRHDHGFLYHHWLLAQLPWTQIITTNFDGFHERATAAAAAATSNAEDRREILRRGNRFPNELKLSPDEQTEMRERCLLFKPYGSLLLPRPVRLGADELSEAKKRFRKILRIFLKPGAQGTLVVLGHSLRDQFLDDIMAGLRKKDDDDELLGRIRLIWVDPVALKRCQKVERGIGDQHRTWDIWMKALLKRHQAGPLPVLAHEFVYDLWRTCAKQWRL